MIYLDNSATTYPKPLKVRQAVASAMQNSANPGRGGYDLAMRASEEIFRTRKTAADFFGFPKEENIIFTLNCTSALNTVMKGILKSGDHVVVSSMEHNAVMRPLQKLTEKGISYTIADVFPCDNDKTVDSFRNAINAKTKMIICTHASNVWGIKLPVERISALAHEYGVLFTLDAAQSAGIVPINLSIQNNIDFLCTAGHKGLYGPMGTGTLIICGNTVPSPLIEGGTGSNSMSFEQPSDLPDRLESGTPNYSGIVGLRAGMDFVSSQKIENISKHEFRLIKYLYRELSKISKVKLYLPEPSEDYFVPLLSFNISDMDSEDVSSRLNKKGIAVRAGLQCSPLAHKSMDTLQTGAVRISPSVMTRQYDIDYLISVIKKI